MNVSRQFKHIHGIPYYLEGSNLYSFEVQGGKPSPDSILLGTYDAEHDTIQFRDDWASSVQHRLDAYREGIISLRRDSFRQTIDKPEKQSTSKRATRAPSRRTKAVIHK